jgi:hypothetical protein
VIRSINNGSITFPQVRPGLRSSVDTVPISASQISVNALEHGKTPGLIAAMNPQTKLIEIRDPSQKVVAELKPGSTLEGANQLIAMGVFNPKGQTPVVPNTANAALVPERNQAIRMV